MVNATKYGCFSAKERGSSVCRGFLVRRDLTDKRLMTHVRENLLSTGAAIQFERYFKEIVNSHTGSASAEKATFEKRLQAIDSEIIKIIDAIAAVGISDSLAGRLKQLEMEKKTTVTRIQGMAGAPSARIPDVQSMFRELLLRLNTEVAENAFAAKPILYDIFGPIQLVLREPDEGPREVWAQIETARTLEYAIGPLIYVVAGAGFEPTTFGL